MQYIREIYKRKVTDLATKVEKMERFKRVAESRTNRIIDQIRLLGNCANRSNYEYSEEDIKKIFANDDNKDSRYVVTSSRFHLMQPSDDTNIRMFREQYSKFHYAGISAAETVNNQLPSDSNKRYPRVIPITNIEFREAWTIGENDPDSMAILPTDKPIIPQGKEQEAPVLKLIETKKQRYGKL